MRTALMLASTSALVLTACSPAERRPYEAADVAGDAAAPAEAMAAQQAAAPPAPVASIAYAFRYALSVPRDRGAELMSRHEQACASAGVGYCQVISARADWTAREPGGSLELRGQPEWINQFRSGLATESRAFGGSLDSAVTEGEDVTRAIDATQTGATTSESLTDRLKALQARRGGTLEQRTAVEREIRELQRQLDEDRVALRALDARVRSARLTIDYSQGGAFAANSPTRPVASALSNAFGLSMGVLGLLITLGSVALPLVAIGGAVWWAVVRRRRNAAPAT